MSKKDLLLEIGLEEMPARFIDQASEQLSERIKQWLNDQAIEYSDVISYATPRRLATFVRDVADSQQVQVEEVKGPANKIAKDADGNWTKPALGFAQSQGVQPADLYVKEFKGNEYLYAQKQTGGNDTFSLLPGLKEVIQAMTFPKNMRWADNDFNFVRPIRWLLAMYGTDVIPFEMTNVSSSNVTYGHRFLGERIHIEEASEYEQALLGQYVIANAAERKRAIKNQIEEIARMKQWSIPIDNDLLDEVTHLVEYPTALYGSFDEEFLDIPNDVLITSMKEHQRYFPVQSNNGELLNYFITVRNGDVDPNAVVAKGNEKVLRARLADARFFYEEDKKMTIESALSQLENVVFHEKLGTIGDKIRRLKTLSLQLANHLGIEKEEQRFIERTAEICKFDLVSQMVYEFPELQGKMGHEYALLAGENSAVAQAVEEHYQPRFTGDETPQSTIGAVVSIADKLDSIASFFSIGVIPSGSQDPYALRRQASGIVQILLSNNWTISLSTLFSLSLAILDKRQLLQRPVNDIETDLVDFFNLRLKNRLQEQHVRYDVIDALLATHEGDLIALFDKAALLMKQVNEESFKTVVESFNRVSNISQKLTREPNINTKLFEEKVEHDLYESYESVLAKVTQQKDERNWEGVFVALTDLQQPIENYFEHVMVMVEDDELRHNRLSLLHEVATLINDFARFDQIVFASN